MMLHNFPVIYSNQIHRRQSHKWTNNSNELLDQMNTLGGKKGKSDLQFANGRVK